MGIRDLKVETVAVSSLHSAPRNPRTHSKAQVRQIADSIRAFGWTVPLLIDGEGGVIAGHGRLAAAKLLGLERAPAIRLSDMTAAQKRAYALADNKLAENAGWDRKLLALELADLIALDPEFEITATGFEMAEIDIVISEFGEDEDADAADENEADRVPAIDPAAPVVTRPGDLWALGAHRLLCADALDPASYTTLLQGEKAQLVFTDPPYNVPIDGHVSRRRSAHGPFAMASGEMDEAQFAAFLNTALRRLADASVDGAIHFVCMDWRSLRPLLAAGEEAYAELKNLVVWAKPNAGLGALYRSQHELIAVFKKGRAPHINNVALGRFGRNRTNVWRYAGMNGFAADRDAALATHPTVKPVVLVEDAIKDCSNRGGVVLDAFAGSGTTLIAAERAGRRGLGIELDPRYVDVTLRRFRDLRGVEPVHAASGLTFKEIEGSRCFAGSADSGGGQANVRAPIDSGAPRSGDDASAQHEGRGR